MISTEEMLEDIIKRNIEFNEVLDANQKGYEVKIIETNNPESYQSYPGFKIISKDDLFTKIRVFLRTEPLRKSRLDESPADTDRSHYMMISYKDGKGGMVINKNEISESKFNKIMTEIQSLDKNRKRKLI